MNMFISDTARLYRMAAEGANFTNGCGRGGELVQVNMGVNKKKQRKRKKK